MIENISMCNEKSKHVMLKYISNKFTTSYIKEIMIYRWIFGIIKRLYYLIFLASNLFPSNFI